MYFFRSRIGYVFFLIFNLLGAFIPSSKAILADTLPYPESQIIESITWDWSSLMQDAPGSDIWPTTWADDNHIYASWGDGGGFGGTTKDGKVAMGIARIEGVPQGYVGVNVNGGKNPLNPASFPSFGKAQGIVSVDGTLYMWIDMEDGDPPSNKLTWSTDHGATWQLSSWSFASDTFMASTFLQFEKDYAGARDGYLYYYGGKWGTGTKDVFLGRVPKAQIKDNNSYQYFAGFDPLGNPAWSRNIESRKPVFADSNSVEVDDALKVQVVYNPGIGRYILTAWHNGPGGLGVFEGPAPWGPWFTIYYTNNFGNMGTVDQGFDQGLSSSFPAKWISRDGLTMWNVFSVYGDGAKIGINGHDQFNLVKTIIKLKS